MIYPNGMLLDSDTAYKIIITNITNPNSDLSSQEFIITTYHTEDIYQSNIISRNTFSPPEISQITVKTCDTFDVELTAVNAFI